MHTPPFLLLVLSLDVKFYVDTFLSEFLYCFLIYCIEREHKYVFLLTNNPEVLETQKIQFMSRHF